MADGEVRIAASAATTLAALHRSAARSLDKAGGGRPSGDLGEGGDEIEAIMHELSNAAHRISANHLGTADRLESTIHHLTEVDDRIGQGFDGVRTR